MGIFFPSLVKMKYHNCLNSHRNIIGLDTLEKLYLSPEIFQNEEERGIRPILFYHFDIQVVDLRQTH